MGGFSFQRATILTTMVEVVLAASELFRRGEEMNQSLYQTVAFLLLSAGTIVECSGQVVSDEVPSGLAIKIVSLENANCVEMDVLLAQVFGKDSFSHAVDRRTNSVVLRGDEKIVEVVEAVLTRLDRPVGNKTPNQKNAAENRNSGVGGGAVALSPVSGTIQPLVTDGQEVKKGEVLAKVQTDAQDQVERHMDSARTEARAEEKVIAAERELQRAVMVVRLAEARLEHAHGETSLEKRMLETELANALAEREALQTRVQMLEDQLNAGQGSGEDLAPLRADEGAAQRRAEILKRRISCMKTPAPDSES